MPLEGEPRRPLTQVLEEVKAVGDLERDDRGILSLPVIERLLEEIEYYLACAEVHGDERAALDYIKASLVTRRRRLRSRF